MLKFQQAAKQKLEKPAGHFSSWPLTRFISVYYLSDSTANLESNFLLIPSRQTIIRKFLSLSTKRKGKMMQEKQRNN
jgi:hypothetical protein